MRSATVAAVFDGQYVDAAAVIEGEPVVVSSVAVSEPVSARFAWRTGAEPNLESGAGVAGRCMQSHRPGDRPG